MMVKLLRLLVALAAAAAVAGDAAAADVELEVVDATTVGSLEATAEQLAALLKEKESLVDSLYSELQRSTTETTEASDKDGDEAPSESGEKRKRKKTRPPTGADGEYAKKTRKPTAADARAEPGAPGGGHAPTDETPEAHADAAADEGARAAAVDEAAGASSTRASAPRRQARGGRDLQRGALACAWVDAACVDAEDAGGRGAATCDAAAEFPTSTDDRTDDAPRRQGARRRRATDEPPADEPPADEPPAYEPPAYEPPAPEAPPAQEAPSSTTRPAEDDEVADDDAPRARRRGSARSSAS
ncbi:hypothetical protein JL722_4569 [Aureococcus anophagefferens]|nr:hypothetical protein JL722_4569 [Aureococcus anophagefferens]